MKVGIVGHGVVGSAMARFLSRCPGHEVVVYDKFVPPFDRSDRKAMVNSSELVFLCVPTPTGADGESCDLSAVEECVGWITPPICIRSTIIPGTVDRLVSATGKAIAFSPEYLGERPNHPWHEEGACGFLIVGGSEAVCDLVESVYADHPDLTTNLHRTTARAAELCKYMENCFLAAKVAFVNQFFEIAEVFGVDFESLRELWLTDPRIGSSHSSVTKERGFRGRCLPKDVAAIVATMRAHGGAPLLEAVLDYNRQLCQVTDQRHTHAG